MNLDIDQANQVEAEMYCEGNLQRISDEQKLVNEYNKITGSQSATWEGDEVTLVQLETQLQDPDREIRERAWRMICKCRAADQDAIHDIWSKLVTLRHQITLEAGFEDYRAYRWMQLHRFDYTPDNCIQFHQAVETVAVPAVGRIYERYCQGLGLASMRPWDLEVDPLGRPPLQPFSDIGELEAKAAAMHFQITQLLNRRTGNPNST